MIVLMVLLTACGWSADDASALPSPDPSLGPWDLLIHGGSVVDGSGAPAFRADLLIRDGVIDFVGRVEPGSVEVAEHFDATGLAVTPGFIDAHAHGDPIADAGFQNFLAMGVTTILLGQDGAGPEAGTLAAHMDEVDGAHPGVNVAYLLGHNTLRRESDVGFGDPGSAGLARMSTLVERALDAGAFGVSTGLEYDPGTRAGMEELVAVARPVAERGGVVMSHMRSEDQDRVEASLAELLEQGRRSGARVHASHLKIVLGSDTTQARRLLSALAEARRDGPGASADVYPYTASFTGLSILFPEWARPPNDYARVVAERRPELAEHLRARVESRNGPGATLFGSGPWAGRTLEEAARETGTPFEEVLIALGPGGASAAYFVMDEGVMATFLRDPWVAVSSDGSPTMRHPRGYGAFPRIIRRFVVEEEMITLEEAVRKMSGLTASIIGLDDQARVETPRGMIRVGWAADLVAFHPDEVRDLADFEQPHRLAEGMRRVWVGGATAWRDGAPVPGPGHGRVIRARHP
jgi:N-acyl-D-amino-acid deacylase